MTVFTPMHLMSSLKLNDAVHHEERIAMRQGAHDFVDVEHAAAAAHRARRHGRYSELRLTSERATSVLGPWPGLTATTCPRRRRPLRVESRR